MITAVEMERGTVVQSIWRDDTGGDDNDVTHERRSGHAEARTVDGDAPRDAESQGRNHSWSVQQHPALCDNETV